MRSKRIKPPEGGKGGQASETEMFCGNHDRMPGRGTIHGSHVDMDRDGAIGSSCLGRADLSGGHVHGTLGDRTEAGADPEAHGAAVL